jgi:hypothetical protein
MSSSPEKSVKLPTFNGSHKSFQLWWTRFVAFAIVSKFIEAISKGGPDPDLPSSESEELDEEDKDDKKMIATRK